MKLTSLTLIAALALSACGGTLDTMTPADATTLSTADLCRAMKHTNNLHRRQGGGGVLNKSPAYYSTQGNQAVYEAELRNRGFSDREAKAIRKGTVYIGMRSVAAQCSWNAVRVSTSMGHGSYSEQWRGAGTHSYYFTDHTDRIDYIST